MKKQLQKIGLILLSVSLLPFSTAMAETSEEKGYRIMKGIDELPVIEKMNSDAIFKIYDSQGKIVFTKKSRSASFTSNYKNPDQRLTKSISYFYAPADDKGNGALMTENHVGDDDQWIYLKGLRKPKRVIGSDKSSSFMGSDFSNGDVSSKDIDDSNHVWLKSETIAFKGKKITVEKIQSVFKKQKMKEDYGYSKSVTWVHPKTGLIFKGELYNLNGQLQKRMQLRSFTVKKNRDGKRVFQVTGMEMANVLKGTKTLMEVRNLKVEKQAKKLNPTIFTTSYLTRKWW
jgi:hypothetical protein